MSGSIRFTVKRIVDSDFAAFTKVFTMIVCKERTYSKTFGLIAVERSTQTRYPKESLRALGELAKNMKEQSRDSVSVFLYRFICVEIRFLSPVFRSACPA